MLIYCLILNFYLIYFSFSKNISRWKNFIILIQIINKLFKKNFTFQTFWYKFYIIEKVKIKIERNWATQYWIVDRNKLYFERNWATQYWIVDRIKKIEYGIL